MDHLEHSYLSYLLRLRWVDNGGQPVCRISLEEPGCEELTHFENLTDLCGFLTAQIGRIETKGGEKRSREKS